VVLDLLLRRVTGKDVHQLLREELVEPLGLTSTTTSVAEAALGSLAVGHFPTGAGEYERTPKLLLPESMAAAGSTLLSTTGDLLRFARTQLPGEPGPLDEAHRRQLQSVTVNDPGSGSTGFSLGWRVFERTDDVVLWHAGGSHGGLALLALEPARRRGWSAFVNAADGLPALALLHEALVDGDGPLAPSTAAVDRPALQADPCGSYARKARRVRIRSEGREEILVEVEAVPEDFADGEVYLRSATTTFRAHLVGPDLYRSTEPVFAGAPYELRFLEPAGGRFGLLLMENRLARRSSEAV
jgi:CubicO group peptidase (beta-lactamase class C family)